MSDILQGLNTPQIQAVTHVDGPVLVLAGAGSGKTKALTHRVAYLFQEKHIPLESILAITFTNKAAGEMKERVVQILGLKADRQLNISTFHSFCSRLLRREAGRIGYTTNFTILDSDDQLTAIKQAMATLNIDTKRIFPEAVRNAISSAKNELLTPEQFANLTLDSFQTHVAEVYPLYQEILKKNQSMDFDDLIMQTVLLFKTQPEVLERYQKQFRYILVDEYQDTNTAQYELADLLAQSHRNLFVVGDDWQSIYSWRGANYQNILDFSKDYPEAVVIKLEQNYRSTQTILDAAHSIIDLNQNRSDKKLWTEAEAGEPVVVYEAINEKDEGDFIIREIKAAQSEGASLSDFVILYRTNAQSRAVEESFLRSGMPYQVVGGVRFYERREIKDMLAYLTLLINPQNELALERVINLPARGIGKKTLSDLVSKAEFAGRPTIEYIWDTEELGKGVKEFGEIWRQVDKAASSTTLSKLLDKILTYTGYKTMLLDTGIEGETRLENIYELKSVMEKYDHLEPREAISIFLEEVALVSDSEARRGEQDCVTLMTMHAAKGLEFDYVFIIGMEENLFPHSRSLFDQTELEEERRLCYVALTRARKKIHITYAKERLIYGSLQNNPPSRFVDALPEHLRQMVTAYGPRIKVSVKPTAVKFSLGAKVHHDEFGDGIIISKSGDVLTIAFRKIGIKNLVADLANLKVHR